MKRLLAPFLLISLLIQSPLLSEETFDKKKYPFSIKSIDGQNYMSLLSYIVDSNGNQVYKLFNLGNRTIEWINREKLDYHESNYPVEYLTALFEHSFLFTATGADPDWEAQISENRFILKVEGREVFNDLIQFNVVSSLTYRFYPSFHADNKKLFGFIHSYEFFDDDYCKLPTLNHQDEIQLLEVFFTYNNHIYNGCISINLKSKG